jgi:hypothetical protein
MGDRPETLKNPLGWQGGRVFPEIPDNFYIARHWFACEAAVGPSA